MITNVLLTTLAVLSIASTASAVSNPIAYWPFDNQITPGEDVAGSHDGTVLGASFSGVDFAPIPGNTGALDFDSPGDQVDVPDADTLDFGPGQPFTIALWMKLQGVPCGGNTDLCVYHVYGKRTAGACANGPNNYQLARDQARIFHFSDRVNFVTAALDPQVDVWTFVAVRHDGANQTQIIVREAGQAPNGSANTTFAPEGGNGQSFKIGTSGGCPPTDSFPGLIDEVVIFDRELTSPELTDLFNGNIEICGNGVIEVGEQCDDGDRNDGDGCSAACLDETCTGDGDCESTTEPALPFVPVTTDPESDGATATDVIETEVTTTNSGIVSIIESTYSGSPPPAGYAFLDRKVQIEAPPASAVFPLDIVFEIHQSLISSNDVTFLNVLRNAQPVPACHGSAALPDPCRYSCNPNGLNPRVCIRSSAASLWTLGVGGCSFLPLPACRQATKSTLVLKHDTENDKKKKLTWTWLKGDQTDAAAFGMPDSPNGSNYTLCLYDESETSTDPEFVTEVIHATALASSQCNDKPCWKALGKPGGSKGFKYKAPDGTPEGLTGLVLKPGAQGKSKVVAKASGGSLAGGPTAFSDALPLGLPVRVQLQASSGECWEAAFDSDGVKKNDGKTFKAKSN